MVIEIEASIIGYDVYIFYRLQLPPMMRIFPSKGLEIIKK